MKYGLQKTESKRCKESKTEPTELLAASWRSVVKDQTEDVGSEPIDRKSSRRIFSYPTSRAP